MENNIDYTTKATTSDYNFVSGYNSFIEKTSDVIKNTKETLSQYETYNTLSSKTSDAIGYASDTIDSAQKKLTQYDQVTVGYKDLVKSYQPEWSKHESVSQYVSLVGNTVLKTASFASASVGSFAATDALFRIFKGSKKIALVEFAMGAFMVASSALPEAEKKAVVIGGALLAVVAQCFKKSSCASIEGRKAGKLPSGSKV